MNRKYQESETTELEERIQDSLKKEVVAFANTNGGEIYIGINDQGEVTGLKNPDLEKTQVTNIVRDSIKPDVTLFVDTSILPAEEKEILRIQISRGSRRPYYIGKKGLRPEGVYVRQGNSSVPASEESIRRMIKEADGDSYEAMRSLNQDLTFRECAEIFQRNQLEFGESQMKTLHILNTDGMFTNLGLLLSDQNPFTLKAAVFQGTSPHLFKDRKEFKGSLLKQFDSIAQFLNLLNPLQSTFRNYQRIDRYGYPQEALREAILNALVHRDYSIPDSSLLSIYEDRIEIVSIGGLVRGMQMEDLKIPVSICRNPNLASVFYRLRYIEQYGTGIGRIFSAYQDAGYLPEFHASSISFQAVLPNRNRPADSVRKTLQDRPVSGNWPEDCQKKILEYLQDQSSISRLEAEAYLSISKTMAVRLLSHMVKSGLLRVQGSGKNTRYLLNK